jgi:hypothetical protein
MKANELNNIIENTLFNEVKKTILKEGKEGKEMFHIKCEGEPLATFETEKEAKEELPKYKKSHPGMELIIEKGVYESHEDMIDKLDEMGEKLEGEDDKLQQNENLNMEKGPVKVKSFAEAILHAKNNNKSKIKIDGEEHDIEESWKRMEEEEMNENSEEECNECGKSMNESEPDEVHDDWYEDEPKDNFIKSLSKIGMHRKERGEFDDMGSEYDDDTVECPHCDGVGHDGVGECENCNGEGKVFKSDDFPTNENWSMEESEDDSISTGNESNKVASKIFGNRQQTGLSKMHKELTKDDNYGHEDDDLKADDIHINRMDIDEEKMGMCQECGGELMEGECMECGYIRESKKKTLRLTENELVSLINKMVKESIPGLTVTKKAQSGSDKENKANMKDVTDKIKKRESFDGNDNPEFPKPIGKGEKMAINNTDDENEYVEDNRGGGLQDLRYENEPSQLFKDRMKKSLEGHATMGNSQDAVNVVKSDLGKNMAKNAERKEKKREKAPMYNKDPQPVKIVKENETPKVLLEEIQKMKNISFYNKKTQ